MVTAQPTFSALRARSRRAGPLHVLWLATLLLGLLYTHGMSAEGAAGHISAAAPAAVQTVSDDGHEDGGHRETADPSVEGPAPGGHNGGHDSSAHPPQDCLSGQPEHGMELPAPCPAPLDAVQTLHAHPAAVTSPIDIASAPPPLRGSSTVLRI
ncbi:DUF6153 family protein [Streptomyces sp. NPDC004647]|uniref:DUF6153 family protein n=1 Tax=Streptomyces sp. NPDC004647 TaxID=3154671 RepID=UPI0033B95C34